LIITATETDAQGNPHIIGQSNPFADSAIPTTTNVTLLHLAHRFDASPVRGITTQFTWSSDSGSLRDLDHVEMAEVVTDEGANVLTSPFGIWIPTRGVGPDTHAIVATSNIPQPGSLGTQHQVYVFVDLRSTPTSALTPAINTIFGIPNAAYDITFNVGLDGKGDPTLTTAKVGKGQTVQGTIPDSQLGLTVVSASSTAGLGSATGTQNWFTGGPDTCVTSCQ
jgi:hypothetical protein